MWNALDERGRNDGYQLSFDDAVRSFLTVIKVTVQGDGIYLYGQRYDSDALRSTGLLDRVARSQRIEINAYLLEACVRHIWIEENGRIIELDLQVAIRVGNEVLYLSLSQLKEIDRLRKIDNASFKEHRNAVGSDIRERFEDNTGQKWDSGSRRSGRPKRGTQTARKEAIEADAIMRGRDVA